MLAFEQEVTTTAQSSQEEKVTFLHCTVTQKELAAALKSVANGVSKRSTLPILANVHISAQDGRIAFTTTNLEAGYRTTITGEVTHEGVITVNHQWLSENVKAIAKTASVTIIATGVVENGKVYGHKIIVSAPGRMYRASGIDAEEFPVLPAYGDALPSVTLPHQTLQQILNEVSIAAASDDSRPVFSGIHFSTDHGTLYIAAADAFRLSYRMVADVEHFHGLFPAYTLVPAIKSLPKQSMVTLRVDEQRCMGVITAGDTLIVTRLIEGTYPNYRAIVPKEHSTRLMVNRLDLLNALNAVKPVAKESSNIVRLAIAHDTITVEAESEDGGKSKSEVMCEQGGNDVTILLNIVYLLDILKATTQEMVYLNLSSCTRPCVIRPVDDCVMNQYMYVVMPMSTNR